jgi:hypothetical protein
MFTAYPTDASRKAASKSLMRRPDSDQTYERLSSENATQMMVLARR